MSRFVSAAPRSLLVGSVAAAVAGLSASAALTNTATSAWPARGVIAYKCANSLCLSDTGGGGQRHLLASARPWPQWDPTFSPDGHELAFRGYYGLGDGAYALYVASVSGCSAKRLTRGVAGDPAWSPDGRWIAFDMSGYGDIDKIHPDGTGLTRLFAGHGVDEGWSPAWSPDSRSIAFVRVRRHGDQIWVMRADGSGAHLLYTDAGRSDWSLAWSHDGRWIAFVSSRTSKPGTIKLIRADGSHVRTLTSQGVQAWNPLWLPHDAGIAFLTGGTRNGSRVGQFDAIRPDGTGRHRLTGPSTIQFAWTAGTLATRHCP
jgi:Tol biopolymer transport system component